MTPTPQKNQDFAPQQSQVLDKDVMQVLKQKGKPKRTPEVEKAKEQIKTVMKHLGLEPDAVIQIGKLARESIKDPSVYQMVVQKATKSGLIKPEQLNPTVNGMDLKLIAAAVTIGKLAEMMKEEGF